MLEDGIADDSAIPMTLFANIPLLRTKYFWVFFHENGGPLWHLIGAILTVGKVRDAFRVARAALLSDYLKREEFSGLFLRYRVANCYLQNVISGREIVL